MVQSQCKRKQSVRAWARCSNDNIKEKEKEKEHFSVSASSGAFCSVRGTKESQCISPPSLDRVHVVIFVM